VFSGFRPSHGQLETDPPPSTTGDISNVVWALALWVLDIFKLAAAKYRQFSTKRTYPLER